MGGNVPNTMPTMKTKNNFCNGCQNEIQKSWDGVGNNAFKNLYEPGGEGKILYTNKISCLELSIGTMKKKQFSELLKK